jgi:hypothetical protein
MKAESIFVMGARPQHDRRALVLVVRAGKIHAYDDLLDALHWHAHDTLEGPRQLQMHAGLQRAFDSDRGAEALSQADLAGRNLGDAREQP